MELLSFDWLLVVLARRSKPPTAPATRYFHKSKQVAVKALPVGSAEATKPLPAAGGAAVSAAQLLGALPGIKFANRAFKDFVHVVFGSSL